MTRQDLFISFMMAMLVVGLGGRSPLLDGSQSLAHSVSSVSPTVDFNGDGFADLAIAAPGEDVGSSATNAGLVNVIYGTASGLSASGDQIVTQNVSGILDTSEQDDFLGTALAAGDFNGDGYSDLAIGAPYEDVGAIANAGAVNVLYGSATGLSAAGNQFWTQDSGSILDTSESNDFMGWALAAGDFNGDGYADLAIGVSGEDVAAVQDAGAVSVLYGSAAGLTATGNQFWSQDSQGILDKSEAGDVFGAALGVGNFNGDAFADLAAGAPGEDVGTSATDGGLVNVIYGSVAGLTASGDQIVTQNISGVLDTSERNDLLGSALAGGDFNGDSFDDLAIGVPGETFSQYAIREGAMNVLYGTPSGLSAANNQFWSQNDVGGYTLYLEEFGAALTTGNFNGDGFADLAVGVPNDDDYQLQHGGVNIVYGTSTGLSSNGSQWWTQQSAGIPDETEEYEHFGSAVGAGDFNRDGFVDLAIGVPNEDLGAFESAGAVHVLLGSGLGLSAAGNQFWTQDTPGINDAAEAGDIFGSSLSTAAFLANPF